MKIIEIIMGGIMPNECDAIPVEGVKGVTAIVDSALALEYESPGVVSYQFDKKHWSQETAEQWVKEKTEVRQPIIKSFTSLGFKNFNDEALSFDATASTDSVDRDGDILRVSGWKLQNYKKNPVLLWGHDSRSLPIGKGLNVRKESGELLFTPKFEEVTMRGETIYNMFKAGYLNAFSVRFDPMEWKKIEPPEDGGKAGERFGRDYTKLELLEISVVTIPANAEALVSRDFQSMLVKSMQCENAELIEDETERKEMLEEEIKMCTGCGKCTDETNEIKRIKEVIGGLGYDEVAEILKAGRVLSGKNRGIISKAMSTLKELLEATQEEPKTADDELNILKGDLKKFEGLDDVDGFIQSAKERLGSIEGGKEND